MNELINNFRASLGQYLGGQIDVRTLEAALIAGVTEEPDVAPTYSAIIEARHRQGQIDEECYLQLIYTVRKLTSRERPNRTAPKSEDRTRLSAAPVRQSRPNGTVPTGPDETLMRPRGSTGPAAAPIGGAGRTGPHTDGLRSKTGSNWSEWGEGPAQPLEPGSVLKERFVLEDVIGRGGMGVVFRARDLRKEEAQDRYPHVAIKVLNEEFKRHPQALRALQREARKAMKAAHPNITTVHDFDRDGGNVFIAMELLDGESLDRVIKRHVAGGIAMKDALPIITGLASALAYGHEQGIVHSDFKPANAFLTRNGVAKVLDFGIARASKQRGILATTTLFDAGSLGALTPAYASCEMIEGEDPDPRDDIYSLGVLTYELLTGRHPFKQLAATQARDAGLTPKSIKGLSKRQWHALRGTLAFKRGDRTATIADFLNEFTPRSMSLGMRFAAVAAGACLLLIAASVLLWSAIRYAPTDSIWFARSIGMLQQLPQWSKTQILSGPVRDTLVTSFQGRIDAAFAPDRGRYNAANAFLVVEELKRLLGEDSATAANVRQQLLARRDGFLNTLRKRFDEALKAGRLLPGNGAESAAEILAIVVQVDPADGLLKDGRFVEASIKAANQAVAADHTELAGRLVAAGRKLAPDNYQFVELDNRIAQGREEGSGHIEVLKAQVQRGLPANPTLEAFSPQVELLTQLVSIAPQDPQVMRWQDDLQRLLTDRIDRDLAAHAVESAQQVLQQFSPVVRPDFVNERRNILLSASHLVAANPQPAPTPQGSQQAQSPQQIRAELDRLLNRPALDQGWDRQLRGQFAKLSVHMAGTDPYIVDARQRAVAAYVKAAATARERRELSKSQWLLEKAGFYDATSSELAEETQRLTQAQALAEQESLDRQLTAEVEGLKQNLLAQVAADDAEGALATLERLRAHLTTGDPFISQQQDEIADLYMDLSEASYTEGKLDEAEALAKQGLKLKPGSAWAKRALAKYEKERNAAPSPPAVPDVQAASAADGH